MRHTTQLARWTMIAALGLAGAAGCSTLRGSNASTVPAVRMVSSPDVPAAEGTLHVAQTSNGNTSIDLSVDHMATPERIQTGATTYVVWARAPGNDRPQNLGALRVDNNLHGTLRTITPLQTFDVFITAEASPTVMAPSNRRVLSASIQSGGR